MLQEQKKYKPVNLIPFELHNIEDFLVGDHPVINPKDPRYKRYWMDQTRKCLDGVWGFDFDKKKEKGGYRFMPGNLYWYMNMCVIRDEDDYGNDVIKSPTLRDVDWLMFYGFSTCQGFSGFSGDRYRTAFRPIGKIQDGKPVSHIEKKFIKIFEDKLRRPDGEWKKYVDARKLLYSTYDEPLGDAEFLNEKLNLVLLSTRRGGKSYGITNGIAGHNFVFDGANSFDEYMDNEGGSNIIVGSIHSDYSTEFLAKFEQTYLHLKNNVGSYQSGKNKTEGWFYHPTSGRGLRETGKTFDKRVKSRDGQSWIGSGSRIVHVTFNNNPQAAVGHGAKTIIVEEAGLLENFDKVHPENKAILEKRRKFGWAVYLGTGGNMKKIQAIKKAFYNPHSYDALAYEDHFSGSGREVGLFIPSYYRRLDYKTEQGNTLLEEAWEDEMMYRKEVKKSGTQAYQRHITSFPIIPEEMFLETGTNIFPVDRLAERKMDLDMGEFDRMAKIGKLVYTDRSKKKVRFAPDMENELTPITEYGVESRLGEKEKEGAIVIYEPPEEDKPSPTYVKPRYIVVYDQVRKEGDGPSLASALVFKFFNNEDMTSCQLNVVAEWIGRYKRIEANHEQVFKLARYYGAKILPEINVTSIKTYARSTRRYHMLQPRPGLALDGDFKQNTKYDVGVYISPGMIPDLEMHLQQLLITPVDTDERLVGNVFEVNEIQVCDKLNSPRLVSELMAYRSEGYENFDSVSAFFLVGVFFLQYKRDTIYNETEQEQEDKTNDFKEFLNGMSGDYTDEFIEDELLEY